MTKKRHPPKRRGKTGVDATLTRHGGLSYMEIPALDKQQSARFYTKVLGWKSRDDGDEPKFSDSTGHLIGRWVTDRAAARRPGLLPFFYVEQIEKAVAQVAAHGGEIVRSPYSEGNLRVSAIRDPAGNLIGLWQEKGTLRR